MIRNSRIPESLVDFVGNEEIDFAVKAGRAQPRSKTIFLLLFGVAWLAFTSIFVVAFLGPLFVGKEVHFESNGVPTVAGPDNLGPALVPAMIIGVFVLVGVIIFTVGVVLMLKRGGYFIGTPLRLIHYRRGRIRSIDWEQFSGDIMLSGNRRKGHIALRMRSGKMVSQKNGPDRYVPEVIYISEIENAHEVEKICRIRIKENDPTPPGEVFDF
jgi:hypothetical protein